MCTQIIRFKIRFIGQVTDFMALGRRKFRMSVRETVLAGFITNFKSFLAQNTSVFAAVER